MLSVSDFDEVNSNKLNKTTMKNIKYLSLVVALACVFSLGFIACSSDDDAKDMTPPVISTEGIVANPINCQVYHRGETIPFNYLFSDDQELGSYNIEIHNNFDHHSHSTEADHDHDHAEGECDDDDHEEGEHEHAEPVKPWVFNQSYSIPEGQRSFTARHDINIPADIDTGDYHFMIRLTDRAGWQQLHAVAIKIIE